MSAHILKQLDIAAYHGDREYTSHSRLRDFASRGPAFYEQRHILGVVEREETKPLLIGQAFETFIQARAVFDANYAVRPAHLDGRTKEGKAWAAANGSKILLSDDDYQAILAMAGSLRATPELSDIMSMFERGEPQVTLRGELYGVKVQARPDVVCFDDEAPYTIDLKTTEDYHDVVSDDGVPGPKFWRYGYHSQAALVRELMRQNGYPDCTCYVLVVEKKPAYRCAGLNLEDVLEDGAQFLAEQLPKLRACLEENRWPRAHACPKRLAAPRRASRAVAAG